MNRPTVYMFKQDEKIIKQLVAEHKGGDTSGDLFGLWTEDSEPVIHLVTGQSGMEKKSFKRSGISTKIGDTEKEIRKMLCENYCLPRIGKWQCQSDTDQNRRELEKSIREDKPLWKKEKKYALIITAHRDNSNLSPYIVSKTSISTRGKIEFLQGEHPFRKVEEIRKMIGDSSVQNDGRNESEGDVEMKPALGDESDNETRVTTYNDSLEAIPGKSDYDSFGGEDRTRQSRPLPELTNFTANDLKVYMFEEDIAMVQNLVLRYPDLETGGDLFGLWTTEGDAVLHIVLGPGKNCSRTNVSFNQDIPYLQRNGELLTENYMLGHIGEWHSHHQLRLFKPSQGDSSTVIRHFPRGATYGFLLIIANIVAPDKVKLSPYLYTQESTFSYSKTGEVVPLGAPNLFRKKSDILKSIKIGKETKQDVHRALLARSQHHSRPLAMGSIRQSQPHRNTHPKAYNGAGVERMEVHHDYDMRTSLSQERKRR